MLDRFDCFEEKIKFSFTEGYFYENMMIERRFLELLKEKMLITSNLFSVLIIIYNIFNSVEAIMPNTSDRKLNQIEGPHAARVICCLIILFLSLALFFVMNNKKTSIHFKKILSKVSIFIVLLDFLRAAISIDLSELKSEGLIQVDNWNVIQSFLMKPEDSCLKFAKLISHNATEINDELANITLFYTKSADFFNSSNPFKMSELIQMNLERSWIEGLSFLMLSYKNNFLALLVSFAMRTVIFNLYANKFNASASDLIKHNIFPAIIYVVMGMIKHMIFMGWIDNFMFMERFKESRRYYEGFINDFNNPILTISNHEEYKPNQKFYDAFYTCCPEEKNSNEANSVSFRKFLSKFKSTSSEQQPSLSFILENINLQIFNYGKTVEALQILKSFPNSDQSFKYYGNFEFLGPQKLYYEISIRIFYLYNKPFCVDLVCQDISNVKLLEAKKTEMQLRGNMFSKIAHEFKTPLITITSQLDTLEENILKLNLNYKNSSFACETSEIMRISSGIKNLARYTNFLILDIIYYSDTRSSIKVSNTIVENIHKDIIDFNYNVLIALLSYWTGDKSQIEPNLRISDSIADYCIATDIIRLNQVVLNILSNAVKFTKKGSIVLDFSVKSKDCLYASIIDPFYLAIGLSNEEENKDLIVIEVHDTGSGITKSVLDNLYSSNLEMSSADYNNSMGSGLGLSIIKNISSSLKIEVIISSRQNGTSYYICIPAYKKTKSDIKSSVKECTLNFKDDSYFNSINDEHVLVELEENNNEPPARCSNKKTSFILEFPKEKEVGSLSIDQGCSFNNQSRPTRLQSKALSFESSQLLIKSSKRELGTKTMNENNMLSSTVLDLKLEKDLIIICDDSKIILDGTEKLLRSIESLMSKYSIVRVTDGSALIADVIKYSATSKLKLVITDENMEYVNGSQAVSLLKQLENNGKIINTTKYVCVTAFEDEDTRRKLSTSGFTNVLSKPLTKSTLIRVLTELKLL